MQSQQPILFVSRALTDTERGYAHIEKELLSVFFEMEQSHHFTFGHKVDVHSDHKPLESFFEEATEECIKVTTMPDIETPVL